MRLWDDVWIDGRYKLNQVSGFDLAIRVSNNIETFHNILVFYLGKKPDMYAFVDGVCKLESRNCVEYLQLLKHGYTHKRRKYFVVRETKITGVFDDIKLKIAEFDGDGTKVPLSFWLIKLIDLQSILYPMKSRKAEKETFNKYTL